MKFLSYCLLFFLLINTACNQAADTTTNTNDTKSTITTKSTPTSTTKKAIEGKTVTLPTGEVISEAEKGITIVSEKGWTKAEMDFQQGYCEQTMASLEDIDGMKFCECFLGKIQYFYKPIYAREAYEDQQKWNSECYQEAQK